MPIAAEKHIQMEHIFKFLNDNAVNLTIQKQIPYCLHVTVTQPLYAWLSYGNGDMSLSVTKDITIRLVLLNFQDTFMEITLLS